MKTQLAALSALVTVSGCASIDQSALVYVSTVKVGISAASGTAEAPGAKVSIGVEANDAAFVPVMVTRRCAVTAATPCEADAYKMVPISGTNSVSETARAEIARIQAGAVGAAVSVVKTKQDALKGAMDGERTAELADQKVNSDKAIVADFDKRQQVATTAGAALTEPAEITAARENVTANSNTAALLIAARQQRQTAASELTAANTDLDEAEIKLGGILAEDPHSEGVKSDAYSVYGSFNSNSNAGAGGTAGPSAGLTMGKTFSTGVAAQLVSEGVKSAAVSTSVGACIAKTKDLADTVTDQAAKAEVLLAGIRACGSIAATQ